jgi:hypothetical protein
MCSQYAASFPVNERFRESRVASGVSGEPYDEQKSMASNRGNNGVGVVCGLAVASSRVQRLSRTQAALHYSNTRGVFASQITSRPGRRGASSEVHALYKSVD